MTTNKLIFPFLIILFSMIIIYGIFNIKYNNKFLNNIEKFQNNYLQNNENNMKLNMVNGIQTTIDFANGNWSWYNSTVNSSNYVVSNMATINLISESQLGTLTFTFIESNGNPEIVTFNIVSILNGNIIATMGNVLSINMSFTNIFTEQIYENPNPSYSIQSAPTATVSIFYGNNLITKFVSYKIYNNIVGGEVYRVIASNDIYVSSPPPTFDFNTYNILINNYVYPSNYAYLEMNGINNSYEEIIKNNYLGKLKFSIQRIYMSPGQKQSDGNPTQIITKISPPITLDVGAGDIPSQLVIVPFQEDKEANHLSNFFQQIGTYVYFYQYSATDTSYYYGNTNLIQHSSSVLNLQNNSDSMFNPNIQYNRLETVTQENQFNFNLIQLPGFFPSTGINNPTIVPFYMIPLNVPFQINQGIISEENNE